MKSNPLALLLGDMMAILGISGMFYFFVAFEVSVPSAGFGRVVNLGLMQDRQNGIIVSSVVLIVGVLLALLSPDKKDSMPVPIRVEYDDDTELQELCDRLDVPSEDEGSLEQAARRIRKQRRMRANNKNS